MKKILFLLIIIVSISGCADKQLTTEQKVKDFEYLYNTLEKNYPYFGVGKRKKGIDWLSQKDKYIQQIRETENDSSYYFTLDFILRDLGNGHTEILG